MSLAAGKLNEAVLAYNFQYNKIPLIQTEGKNDFDFILPDGRTVEAKLDMRSQTTGNLALEWPTLQRGAEIYILTTTTARVFTHQEINQLYNAGKIPEGGFGQQGYDGRYVSLKDYWNTGKRLYEFINQLK